MQLSNGINNAREADTMKNFLASWVKMFVDTTLTLCDLLSIRPDLHIFGFKQVLPHVRDTVIDV